MRLSSQRARNTRAVSLKPRLIVYPLHGGRATPVQHQRQALKALSEPAKRPDVEWSASLPAFLFPALGGGLFGYDIGVSSSVVASISDPNLAATGWVQLTE